MLLSDVLTGYYMKKDSELGLMCCVLLVGGFWLGFF